MDDLGGVAGGLIYCYDTNDKKKEWVKVACPHCGCESVSGVDNRQHFADKKASWAFLRSSTLTCDACGHTDSGIRFQFRIIS